MAQAVVAVNGEQVQVEGRAATMIAYLATQASRVNVPQKGSVTFHFADAEITPNIVAIDTPLSVNGQVR